jgi:uncharacterized protein YaiI (UPF0178 family)
LGAFVPTFEYFFEMMQDSLRAASRSEFEKFGLTDSVLGQLAIEHLVITDDLRLAKRINDAGQEVLNFNHIRLFAG